MMTVVETAAERPSAPGGTQDVFYARRGRNGDFEQM